MRTFAVALTVLPSLVQGHAFIYYPAPRQGAAGNAANGYCPHCLGSTDLPMPTCGQSKWLNFADGPVTELTAGQHVKFEIKVTAHHKGHFVFRLCNRTISGALGGMDGEEACLNQHILERVRPEEMYSDCKANDKRGDCQPFDEANPGYWYLPPATDGDTINLLERNGTGPSLAQVGSHSERAGAYYTFHYKLPAGLTCEKCTLQWWWLSANSCTPHPDAYRCYFGKMQEAGWNASRWCGGGCSYSGSCPAQQGSMRQCGEQFKNCADLKIVHSSSQPGAPATTQQPTLPPTQQPVSTQPPATQPGSTQPSSPTEPEPESEEEEEEETEEEEEEEETEEEEKEEEVKCTAVPGKNAGATDETCQKCATGYEFWPCGGDLCSCVGGGSAGTAPTASPPAAGTCVANPEKIVSNGVTDQTCQQCATGYQWWPCNQENFCICGESLLGRASSSTARLAEAKEHRFLGLIQQSDEVQRAAFEGGEAGARGDEL